MQMRRAFIFANGQRIHLENVRKMITTDDYRVAADGGLRFLHALGLKPDLLIGDLDSISPAELEAAQVEGLEVRRYPVHKDETDLELALEAVIAGGYEEIRIVGALGGRLDMTLANLFLLFLPGLKDRDAHFEDGYEEVLLIRPDKPARISGMEGERVSLLPLNGPAGGIRTEGLYYPLRGETLQPERTRGISNVMTGPHALVSLETGLLLCIHSRLASLSEEVEYKPLS
jgi:thiamine pyrophosphokinase